MVTHTLNPFEHTMTNPNINIIISLLNGALLQYKPTAADFNSVHTITDKISVSILNMASFW